MALKSIKEASPIRFSMENAKFSLLLILSPDKKKEIVLRRAVKEGEDPDEVEMVLEARFYEKHN